MFRIDRLRVLEPVLPMSCMMRPAARCTYGGVQQMPQNAKHQRAYMRKQAFQKAFEQGARSELGAQAVWPPAALLVAWPGVVPAPGCMLHRRTGPSDCTTSRYVASPDHVEGL